MRHLKLSLWITALSASLAFLIAFGSRDLARADGDTNAPPDTNVEQDAAATVPPPAATAPADAEANDEPPAATNTIPQALMDILHPELKAPATPTPPPAPQPQRVPTQSQIIPPSPQPVPAETQPSQVAATTPQPVPATPPAPKPAAPPEVPSIDFEFQSAPINAILDWYSRLTERSIISAPNLAITVNFRSQTKLTRAEAIQALDSVLAINNIAAIPLGEKFLKIVQINTAKQEGLPIGKILVPADTLGTQIIPLKNAKASDVVAVLQPYLHPYGALMPLQDSNSILISETAANLKQMLEIVAYVDQPSTLRMEMRSYVMAHAKAADVMQRLQQILQEAEQAGAHAAAPAGQPSPIRRLPQPGQPPPAAGGEGGTVVEGKVIMAADERTNKIFILTRSSNFGFFDKLIAELDAKVEPDVLMKVITLNYATAEDIASLLNALITGGSVSTTPRRTTSSTGSTTTGARPPSIPPPPVTGGSSGGGALNTGLLQYAEGVRILPDPRTNTLLVMATKEDMVRIQQLVHSLDTSVAQVEIEVVIAEITLNNELDVGVDVFKRLVGGTVTGSGGNATDGNAPIQLPTAGNVASAIGSNAIPTAAALASGPGGLTYFTTFQHLGLDTVLHALASTSKSKVLSTPVILTMDNQEASIIVGESVPVPQNTVSSIVGNNGTLATGQLNASIEYQDVAIELTVTPRINPDGYVRMDIEQKVNDLGASVNIGGTVAPTILKRQAKSSVAVQDKSTIMLGGLIKEEITKTETKVPFLGDIPFFGQVFKGQTNNKQRNELVIFIRPSVLRTDDAAMAEAARRTRGLNLGRDLDLDQFFPSRDNPTNWPPQTTTPAKPAAPAKSAVPATTTSVVPPNPPTVAAAQPTQNSSDRQSDKVKALKLQDGDISMQ
ncbi:MAG TPA: type II secretion system secretin GspD [Verrucomicrobiae bacterium]|nr:type II secretion system secretin GspD [Verrucomicrobiae bacterium]